MAKRIARIIMSLMLFAGLFQADTLLADDTATTTWGLFKATQSEAENTQAAAKMSVSGRKAGGMHSIILRQPVGTEYGLPSNLKYTPGLKDAFVSEDQGYLVINLYFDARQVPRETGYFGFLYSFKGDRIKVESSFFGYDEGRTYYMVRFLAPYVGSPAQESLLGRESGQGILSVWYVKYSPDDYDGLWTVANVSFPDMDFTLVRIQPLGEFPGSQLDLRWEQVAMSGDITEPLKHLSFVINREPHVRFFEISAGGYSWTVQLPVVPELNIGISSSGVGVGIPRP